MAITLHSPTGLPRAEGVYDHVAVTTGSRTLYLAGQVSWDADGTTVGPGDLAAQVAQALRNVATALSAGGATLDDVAKLTFHVVDWHPDKMAALLEGIARGRAELAFRATPPATLLGVAALDVPDHLVEIEAVAVLP